MREDGEVKELVIDRGKPLFERKQIDYRHPSVWAAAVPSIAAFFLWLLDYSGFHLPNS
jgi:hypothetical protein